MATVNILIGVGGTGAKVVEAALYMLAAGAGPEKVIVGLVDQDNNNGNLSRTIDLFNEIVAARGDWKGANRLDWKTSVAKGGSALLRTELAPLLPAGPHYQPATGSEQNLATILDRAQMTLGEQALFDLLFRREGDDRDIEQTLDLSRGYRGRANVGAAAMIASLEIDAPAFKTRLKELIDESKQANDVRIFLVGSVFGGTGAAGFPTLARALNRMRKSAEVAPAKGEQANGKVLIGGALMLPYFTFASGPAEENAVRSDELLPQTRIALEYYDSLFATEGVFDRFYVVGSDELFPLRYFSSGNNGQTNPALPPELLGAMAAINFLTGNPQRATTPPIFVSARGGQSFTWPDMPDMPGELSLEPLIYDRLGRLLRQAYYWRYAIEPELAARDGRSWLAALKSRDPAWLDLAAETDWSQDTPDARTHLSRLFASLLVWASSMQLFAEGVSELALWDTRDLCARREKDKPCDPVSLSDTKSGKELNSIYMRLLAPRAEDKRRTANDLYDEITRKRATDTGTGNVKFGRLAEAVNRAARPEEREI